MPKPGRAVDHSGSASASNPGAGGLIETSAKWRRK